MPRTLADIIEGARAVWPLSGNLACGMGRYNAGAGRRRASFAQLTAYFTLGYTEKTSIQAGDFQDPPDLPGLPPPRSSAVTRWSR
jgi:hypothetical protein